MASRTYLPALIALLKAVCNYIVKHRDRIIETIGAEHASKVDGIVTACGLFLNVALPFIEEGV